MAGRMKVDVGRMCTPDGYLRGNSARARAPPVSDLLLA